MKMDLKTLVTIFCLSVCSMPCFAECPSGDLTGDCRVDFKDFAIFAKQWLTEGEPFPVLNGMTWVSISDPGISGHNGFIGEMAKYETTNAQYCAFLNAAIATGDIIVDGNNILGASGSNSGEDFIGGLYYDLAGYGLSYYGATNGGAARINYSGGSFNVDSGFENHPVTHVSWYGAMAFAAYYGYRLPSEWEWQAVADYDGTYNYGCGISINNSIANYISSNHPDGTSVVGSFGEYGYGVCDMAGNVWEWTGELGYGIYCVARGGGWTAESDWCTVWFQANFSIKDYTAMAWGFRVCH